MLPGFLHFECHNLRAELINSALFHLSLDENCIIDALKSLGFTDINIRTKTLPISMTLIVNANHSDIFSLDDVKNLFRNKKVSSNISSLALEILEAHDFLNQDYIWLTKELAILCAQIAKLDPKFISSGKIRLGSIKSEWHSLLIGMPIIEVEEKIDADLLSLAFLKTLVGHWGARGEHRLLKVGIAKTDDQMIQALWCEATLPESMNECGPSNKARLSFVHKVSGLVPTFLDMNDLSSSLALHGAKSFSWHLVYAEKQANYYQANFFCSDFDKKDALEAFLIKGQADQISASVVERHELNKRQVAIPMGKGNKTGSMRFWEFIYYDKILRVEPLKEDLEQYILETDYSPDVARADALLAWKKWRGRVAEDK